MSIISREEHALIILYLIIILVTCIFITINRYEEASNFDTAVTYVLFIITLGLFIYNFIGYYRGWKVNNFKIYLFLIITSIMFLCISNIDSDNIMTLIFIGLFVISFFSLLRLIYVDEIIN